MDKLLIFPYNSNGIEAIDCIAGQYELIGFIDDSKEKQGTRKYGLEVFSREALDKYPEAKILAVPGSYYNFIPKESIIRGLKLDDSRFAAVVHPRANVSPMAEIGFNVLIMAGVAVTSSSVLGNHICIMPNSVIHHNCIIDDYCVVGANVTLTGHVKVQKNCYIGSGSIISNNIEIGERSLIGLGSKVIRSVPNHSIAIGNPAQILGDTKEDY